MSILRTSDGRIIGGWNKHDKDYITQYCLIHNIEFIDEYYIGNSYKHAWKCNLCSCIVKQSLVKIKRANGKLKCCSQVSNKNNRITNKLHECSTLSKKFNISLESDYINNVLKLKWKCNLHTI